MPEFFTSSQLDTTPCVGLQDMSRPLEADQLDKTIHPEHRVAPLRQQNALRCSTNVFPNEILAVIFIAACPPIDLSKRPWPCWDEKHDISEDDVSDQIWPLNPRVIEDVSYRYFPLVISSVCSLWREISTSTPSLWDSIALKPTYHGLQSQVEILSLYLRNSKQSPFSLGLDLREYTHVRKQQERPFISGHHIEVASLEPFKILLIEQASRLRILRIFEPPLDWLPLLDHFVDLEDLGVGWPNYLGPRGNDILLPTSPRLQRLTLSGIRSDSLLEFQIFSSKITVLHLHGVQMRISLDLLFTCRQLVEFHNYDPVYIGFLPSTYFDEASLSASTFTLQHMRSFGWTLLSDLDYDDLILQNLRMPKLQELTWSGMLYDEDGYAYGQHNARWGLLHEPETLRSLKFYGIREGLNEDYFCHFQSILRSARKARELGFIMCSSTFISDILTIVSRPTIAAQKATAGDSGLPSLELIRVEHLAQESRSDSRDPYSPKPPVRFSFLELKLLVDERSMALQTQRLRVELDCEVEIQDRIRFELWKAVQKGFKLSVIHNQMSLEWLQEDFVMEDPHSLAWRMAVPGTDDDQISGHH